MRKPTVNWFERTCLICSSIFKTMPCKVKDGGGKYCSRKCRNVAGGNAAVKIKDQKGENNRNYKGGISKDRYRYKVVYAKNNPEKIKANDAVKRAKKSKKLREMPCEICGEINNVHAHHENYKKPLEVIWLCHKCHHKRHH